MSYSDSSPNPVVRLTRDGAARISVVVPCFNEEAVIGLSHARLKAVLESLLTTERMDYEIIYVDDGSRDLTATKLTDLAAHDAHVRVVMLSRNFGHQPAVTAGPAQSRGVKAFRRSRHSPEPNEYGRSSRTRVGLSTRTRH